MTTQITAVAAKRWLLLLFPLLLLAALVMFFLTAGSPGVLKPEVPPIEELAISRFELAPDLIRVHLINDGPDPVRVSQVLVNDAYRRFTIVPEGPLTRLQRAVIEIPYPWLEGDPQEIVLVTSTGLTIGGTVEVATATPGISPRYVGSLGLLGIYIGVIPVFLGILWLPFMRRLQEAWFQFLLALTLGLLLFLGVDSLVEAVEAMATTPQSLKSLGVLIFGFAAAFLLIYAVSSSRRRSGSAQKTDDAKARLAVAFTIAFGIGVHNLGEGLAIGGAYALGNVSLGTMLVVGFMIHNVTEGVAIVAPVSRVPSPLRALVLMGLVAGLPAVVGAWIGGFAYSAIWAVFFLAVGSGAIFQVFLEILAHMARDGLKRLLTFRNALGFLAGVVVMYGTSLLVAA
jgi:zinc transporter ZupT